MSKYTLPELPYDFGALEPHISGKVMELHHGNHHAAYVKKANETLEQLDEARETDDFSGSPRSSARSRSTSRATSSTRSSGRT